MFELLTGRPPFKNADRELLFNKIRKEEPDYTKMVDVSAETKDLIKQLLKKKLRDRIDPISIPHHPAFENFNYYDISNRLATPPIRPKIVKP